MKVYGIVDDDKFKLEGEASEYKKDIVDFLFSAKQSHSRIRD